MTKDIWDRKPKRAPYKPPKPLESTEQIYFVSYVRNRYPEESTYMTAVPHGGFRHKATAGRLKAEGVSPGYPDILVDLPRGDYCGLRIELKRQGSSPSDTSPEQEDWIARLNGAGYWAEVARGADEAIRIFEEYLRRGVHHRP